MEYTTVPAEAPVKFNRCEIEFPVPLLAPLTPVCVTVQSKVVADKLLVRFIELAEPVHKVCDAGDAVAVGSGFTVIVTNTGDADAQPLADGVIVYTAVPGELPVADSV
jgi:hypothetical protein